MKAARDELSLADKTPSSNFLISLWTDAALHVESSMP